MAATKDALVSDIILRISGGKPSDDLELERSQVAFWITQMSNLVVKDYLDKRLRNGEFIDPVFVEKASCKELIKEVSNCDDCSRYFVELPKEPMDLFDDSAVVRVRTGEGSKVSKANLTEMDMIGEMEFTRPSVENLVYFREGYRIIIEGIPTPLQAMTPINVWYVPKVDLECMGDSDEIKFPADLVASILEAAEQLGRRQVFGPQDLENDGQQDLTIQPK